MDEASLFNASEQPKPVMAHVLFIDVVGYTKQTTDQQTQTQLQLQEIVKSAPECNRAEAAHQLIRNPTGDGMALVFFDDVFAAARCAVEMAQRLLKSSAFGVRMGVNSGPVYRTVDINGKENVVGGGINMAQRVMDCGDSGHILMSAAHAQFLREFDPWKNQLTDIGTAEVKHGFKVHLFNYCDGTVGNPALPAKMKAASAGPAIITSAPAPMVSAAVALFYKRGATRDEELLAFLEKDLSRRGCRVFIDRYLKVGIDWAKEIERVIGTVDAVVPLLSPAAAESEMLSFEIQIADEVSRQRNGKPRILPVRVNWEGPLPSLLAGLLNRYQYALWRGPEDNKSVAEELAAALIAPPSASPSAQNLTLETPGGAVPLNSTFYVVRPTDCDFLKAIDRRDSIVLLDGARQMGKTSLLSRGLQQARKAGAKVVFTDFQKLNNANLESLESFYKTLGAALGDQLDLDAFPEDVWRAQRGPNENFERYLRREVLEKIAAPLVWGLDEVDRLFTCPFAGEVFGLFRSWHNARALDPESPWGRLTQVITYATEAHLFITDLNQSPFNVGTRVKLDDFTPDQVADLNIRYGNPLRGEGELKIFNQLLGGQPYLVRRGLHELASRELRFDAFEKNASSDDGPFGDHLRRFLVLLTRDSELLQAVRGLLKTGETPERMVFHRLRSAGILRGDAPAETRFRCKIYETCLGRHLL
jgi:class 3 adenylate cyclase